MNNKTKLLILDMEGTIFKKEFKGINEDTSNNAWEMISHYLGEKAVNFQKTSLKEWENEKLNYIEFMEKTAQMHQDNNLDQEFFNKVINYIPYREGFPEFIYKVNEKNIRTAIITGGLKAQAERVKKDFDINHVFASGEYYWDKDGNLIDWNILPTGHYGKPLCAKQLSESLNIDPINISFIGDGINDIPIMDYVQGKTVAINGCIELNKKSDIQINTNNTENTYEVIYDEIFSPEITN